MPFLLLKSLHIIFVVTWFSGLFYIVRLFIYHTESNEKAEPEKSILQKQFKIMEQRLWYFITWPSAILTLIFGPGMSWWNRTASGVISILTWNVRCIVLLYSAHSFFAVWQLMYMCTVFDILVSQSLHFADSSSLVLYEFLRGVQFCLQNILKARSIAFGEDTAFITELIAGDHKMSSSFMEYASIAFWTAGGNCMLYFLIWSFNIGL